jgi:hypothetical protein
MIMKSIHGIAIFGALLMQCTISLAALRKPHEYEYDYEYPSDLDTLPDLIPDSLLDLPIPSCMPTDNPITESFYQFEVIIEIQGVDCASFMFDAKSQMACLEAMKNVEGFDSVWSEVYQKDMPSCDTHLFGYGRKLQIDSVTVTYVIETYMNEITCQSFPTSYSSMTQNLQDQIMTGNFTRNMRMYCDHYNCKSVKDSSVIEPAIVSDYDTTAAPNKNNGADHVPPIGTLIGVIIGTFFLVCVLIVVIIVFVYIAKHPLGPPPHYTPVSSNQPHVETTTAPVQQSVPVVPSAPVAPACSESNPQTTNTNQQSTTNSTAPPSTSSAQQSTSV